jgi:hypothetical protein
LSLRINAIVDDHIAVAVALVFAKLSNTWTKTSIELQLTLRAVDPDAPWAWN